VETAEPKLAVSFDASWGAERTETLLDILDEYNVKTTFFLVNIWMEDYPELCREIAERGHEVEMHSASHPHFNTLSEEEMRRELEENAALIYELTGRRPLLFRPPFGEYNNTLIQLSESMGYQSIQWSVDSLDWKELSSAEIVERVSRKAGPGDIVLFHNDGLNTPEALRQLLALWQEQGLSVVPVGELLLEGETYIDYNGMQKQS
jgi:polysaccharide deacetylase family sporulation protein PdaB